MNPSDTFLPRLDRAWTVYLIHHAHTDIGYTDTQDRISRRHVHFLDQALNIIHRARAGDPGLQGFVWNSECFWSIEQWLRETPEPRHAELAAAVREGWIGLSGTYLHFTELVDDSTLHQMLAKGAEYARTLGVPLDTAVSADINGFGWGYAQAMYDAGIRNLVVCLHAHHGLAPIGKRQAPFWWETPGGNEILVWLNEHYMLGNVLGLSPHATFTYSFADELAPTPHTADHWAVARTRLPRYLRQLEADGYPANFVPIHVAGMVTDNSPPSEAIIRFIQQWNARHGDQIRLEMATAAAVSARVRQSFPSIPRYRGDWPDWWSDGLASTPDATRLCRHAQREMQYLRLLQQRFAAPFPMDRQHRIADAVAMFAEHTFNHSDAMLAPWNLECKAIHLGKTRFAAESFAQALGALDHAFAALGEAPPGPDRPFIYRAINPFPTTVRDVTKLYLESCDFHVRNIAATVVNLATGQVLPHQTTPASRGVSLDVRLDLPPGQSAWLEIREGVPTLTHNQRSYCETGLPTGSPADVAGDEDPPRVVASSQYLESPFVRLNFAPELGVVSWLDKIAGCELLRPDAVHTPFLPVYDVTPVTPPNDDAPDIGRNALILTRSRMGRNRKGFDARYHVGRLQSAKAVEQGPLRATVQLEYEIEGCAFYRVLLSVWADLPRVDVKIRLHKRSVWEPENLYIALPLAVGGGQNSELWIEKAGVLLRPWQDQLPDSLTDFYCLQNGLVMLGSGRGLVVAMPDTPLLQLGDLHHGPRPLMGNSRLSPNTFSPYAWVMTNYWETNFEASLGGFHEFTFRVEWGPHIQTAAAGIELCRSLNLGLKNFRTTVTTIP